MRTIFLSLFLPFLAFAAPPRIVAIGDVHGDFKAAKAALRLAGLIDAKDHWSGGKTIFVQTGDVLDRGDGEQGIFMLLWRLRDEAKAAGGRVVLLNGNHEIMNAQGDMRYVTPGGFMDFAPEGSSLAEAKATRIKLFKPGGLMALQLAHNGVIAIVGETAFVHGGVLPKHARYGIPKINSEVQAWLKGEVPDLMPIMQGNESPIWTRLYSAGNDPARCSTLRETLKLLKIKRMVVGHTVQRQGITSACDGLVWRIDVGMAAHYGGRPAALEIQGDTVRALTE